MSEPYPALRPEVVLGSGAVYDVRGDWEGFGLRPSAEVVAKAFTDAGFRARFIEAEEIEGRTTSLFGFVSPIGEGRTVLEVLQVLGAARASWADVWPSTVCNSDELDRMLLGESIEEFGESIFHGFKAIVEASTETTDLLTTLIRWWPITAIVVASVALVGVFVYFKAKKKGKK